MLIIHQLLKDDIQVIKTVNTFSQLLDEEQREHTRSAIRINFHSGKIQSQFEISTT